MIERRFYIRYVSRASLTGVMRAIMYRYGAPDGMPKFDGLLFSAEIPAEHFDKSLDEVSAFFDHGTKPRVRVAP